MSHNIKAGVATGKEVQDIFKYAKEKGFALPAVNVIGSNTINSVLETARDLNAPVIIQFSNGGAAFNAGKGLSNENQKAAIAGAIIGAKHIHLLAKEYGVPVILHTDHCAKKLLPWIDGLLDAGEKHYAETRIREIELSGWERIRLSVGQLEADILATCISSPLLGTLDHRSRDVDREYRAGGD